MYKLSNIRDVHLELTSKCQARCPMCPRRINGGILNPLITLTEIDLVTFKQWFPEDFLQQLDSLFMCGNLGDPIIAQDCVEIFEYLRITNPAIKLSMHTNGSARTKEFWQALAQYDVRIVFGIDGLVDTHSLYRVSTDFNLIINNAQTFIQAGGRAEWHMLAFAHNEHQISTAKQMAADMGFASFQVKHTSRFTGTDLHVLNDKGKTTHVIQPTARSQELMNRVKDAVATDCASIQCKAQQSQSIYVGSSGTVSPCCWLDAEWIVPNHANRIDYMDLVGEFPNLNKQTLQQIFDSGYFDRIESTWAVKPLAECSRQCGKFDKLGEQFSE